MAAKDKVVEREKTNISCLYGLNQSKHRMRAVQYKNDRCRNYFRPSKYKESHSELVNLDNHCYFFEGNLIGKIPAKYSKSLRCSFIHVVVFLNTP